MVSIGFNYAFSNNKFNSLVQKYSFGNNWRVLWTYCGRRSHEIFSVSFKNFKNDWFILFLFLKIAIIVLKRIFLQKIQVKNLIVLNKK